MKDIGKTLNGIGAFLALIGVVSSILYLINYNLRILAWIDVWGTGIGWIIRIGLIVGGAALFFLFKGAEDDEAEAEMDWDEYRAKVKADPRFSQLLAQAQQQHAISLEPTTDPETYHLVHVAFTNDTGQVLMPDDQTAKYLSLYLKRGNAPKRLQVGQTLATGETGTTELSGMQWSMVVP
jgi:hypothetical protein